VKPTLRSWWRSNKCSKSELVQACADIILLDAHWLDTDRDKKSALYDGALGR